VRAISRGLHAHIIHQDCADASLMNFPQMLEQQFITAEFLATSRTVTMRCNTRFSDRPSFCNNRALISLTRWLYMDGSFPFLSVIVEKNALIFD